jgi:hypothetical protein
MGHLLQTRAGQSALEGERQSGGYYLQCSVRG